MALNAAQQLVLSDFFTLQKTTIPATNAALAAKLITRDAAVADAAAKRTALQNAFPGAATVNNGAFQTAADNDATSQATLKARESEYAALQQEQASNDAQKAALLEQWKQLAGT